MIHAQFRTRGRALKHARLLATGGALLLVSGAAACRIPYKYPYENKTGVGLTDRATDYCQRAAVRQGYQSVREAGPKLLDSPSEVNVRMRVTDGDGELIVGCQFDDKKRIAAIPSPQRGNVKRGEIGYIADDAKKARSVCDRAVRGSGYDARNISVAEWTGGRTFRVNVAVRQDGSDRSVACRYDGVAGTASVPPVTK